MDSKTYDSFIKALRQDIPGFDKIDSDPEFLAWVDSLGIDLRQIGGSLDYDRAVNIYRTWIRKKRQEAARQKQQASKWTKAQITEAYDRIARGQYKQQDADRIKRDIFKAQREGRIVD